LERDSFATGAFGLDTAFGKLYWGEQPVINGQLSSATMMRRANANLVFDYRLYRNVYSPADELVMQFSNAFPPTGVAFGTVAGATITKPDLTISQASSRNPVAPTDPLTFTLTIQNVGPSVAAGVVLTDTLPTGATFVSATSSRGETCPAPSGGTLTCSLSDIPFGMPVVVNVRTTVNSGFLGQLTNRASVRFADPDPSPSNNTTSLTVGVNTATPTPTPTSTRVPATATPTAQVKSIYWTDRNAINAIGTDGSNQRAVLSPVGLFTSGIAVDPVNEFMYWGEQTPNVIRRAKLDGTGAIDITTPANSPVALAIDTTFTLLFWRTQSTTAAQDLIQMYDLHNHTLSTLATLVSVGSSRPIGGLAIDPGRQKVYWAETTGPGGLWTIKRKGYLFGGTVEIVHTFNDAVLGSNATVPPKR
jgi:uncharacterized repeat protein (TIGR01451 family)